MQWKSLKKKWRDFTTTKYFTWEYLNVSSSFWSFFFPYALHLFITKHTNVRRAQEVTSRTQSDWYHCVLISRMQCLQNSTQNTDDSAKAINNFKQELMCVRTACVLHWHTYSIILKTWKALKKTPKDVTTQLQIILSKHLNKISHYRTEPPLSSCWI